MHIYDHIGLLRVLVDFVTFATVLREMTYYRTPACFGYFHYSTHLSGGVFIRAVKITNF